MGYHIFMRVSMFSIKAFSIPLARAALGWEIGFSPTGDVNTIDFVGEKYRADEDPLLAIAPFVEDDSYIEMQGKGGETWRWVLRQGRLYELEAEITWSENEIAAPARFRRRAGCYEGRAIGSARLMPIWKRN